MKFKVGDIIVGKESSNEHYCITCKNNKFVGRVECVYDSYYEDIEVRVLKVEEDEDDIGALLQVHSGHFELLKNNLKTVRELGGAK